MEDKDNKQNAKSAAADKQALVKKYAEMLRQLNSQRTRILHYATYRKDKIQSISFSSLIDKSVQIPSEFKLYKFIIDNDANKYVNYKNNVHHWTTDYCWKNVVPKLLNDCSIKLDSSKFKKVDFVWNNCDFSYHEELANSKYEVEDFANQDKYTGYHNILRNVNNSPFMQISLYHSLFVLSHKSGLIQNLSTDSNKTLVINCDSMAIPIIPILACFFRKILVVDNRTGFQCNYYKQILDFKPDCYISLFTEENMLFRHKFCLQLQ